MLCGEYPFSHPDLLTKMFESPKNAREINKAISEKLDYTLNLCLNPDPKKRLSAHELWARLRTVRV